MALHPADMKTAILRNLEEKSGHPLSYWHDRLHRSQPTDRKLALKFLTDAGLGHYQAQTVYETWRGQDDYADEEALIAGVIPSDLRSDYDTFASTCISLGEDVHARPCRTYVPFYAEKQFAIVTEKGGRLVVGLALPASYFASELEPATGLGGSKRINHSFTLPEGGEPTVAQAGHLKAAYRHAH